MQPLADPAIAVAKSGDVSFVPDRFQGVYLNWMENIHDWCISRQLWWGHRIPVWYCQAMRFDHRDHRRGDCRLSGLWRRGRAGSGRARHLVQLRAVALFDARLAGGNRRSPSLLSLAHHGDRLRDSLFLGRADGLFRHRNDGRIRLSIPFICMARCAIPTASRCRKTKGNVLDPTEITAQYGADALRFALVTQGSPGLDMRLSMTLVESSRNFVNKLWNATRFALKAIESSRGRSRCRRDSRDRTESLRLLTAGF